MEIRLGVLEEGEITGFSFKDAISIEQFEEIQASIKNLFQFDENNNLFKLVLLNDQDLNVFLNQSFEIITNKLSQKWNGLSDIESQEMHLELNKHFLNYLSSIRTFLDHSETFLNRKFGSDSSQLKKFKELCSYFYDNSFAYRFFYRLRNYSQHCGLPIQVFRHAIKNDASSAYIEINIIVAFRKKDLLDNFDKWSTVKKELECLPDEIEFISLFKEMTNNIKNLSHSLKLIISEDAIDSASYLNGLIKHLRSPNDNATVAVFHDITEDEKGNLAQVSILNIPLHLIDMLINE